MVGGGVSSRGNGLMGVARAAIQSAAFVRSEGTSHTRPRRNRSASALRRCDSSRALRCASSRSKRAYIGCGNSNFSHCMAGRVGDQERLRALASGRSPSPVAIAMSHLPVSASLTTEAAGAGACILHVHSFVYHSFEDDDKETALLSYTRFVCVTIFDVCKFLSSSTGYSGPR